MTERGVRTLRGTAAATFAVFVAAVFHDGAGGGLPSPLAVTLSLAFAVPLCIALSGRGLSLWRQAASVGVSQLLLHLLFGLGSNPTGTSLRMPAGHLHAGSHIDLVAGQAAPMQHDSPTMLLAHGLAAVVTLAALRYGERALRTLADAAALLVTSIMRIVLVPIEAPTREPARDVPIVPAASVRVLGLLRHRGPPLPV
jgi:hypothetical protein